MNDSARRFVTQHWTGVIGAILFGLSAWWIYPFADLSKNPAFNSDSAVVLSMATQNVPVTQSIFYWGTARSGSLLVAGGWVICGRLSEHQIVQFFSVAAACFAALACTIVVGPRGTTHSRNSIAVLPAGIFILGANFAVPPSFVSLSWLMTDIASRPELPCLLIAMSWLAVRVSDPRSTSARGYWNWLFIGYLLVASTAAWISDFGLVAALMIPLVLAVLATLRRDRLPWELFLGVLVAGISLYLLRHMSPYGAAQTKSLLRVVNEGSFRALLGPAVVNIVHQLTWSTWVAIAVIIGTFALWSVVHHKTAAVWSSNPACVQFFLLTTLSLSEIATALANQWVYDNGVFPRYFTPGIVLLCLAATQCAVFLIRESMWFGYRNGQPFAYVVCLMLLLPAVLSARDSFATRQNLARARHSVQYASSDALYRAGARAVVGPYWKSYVNVVAHPVRLKATPRDGDEDRSAANTMNCLRAAKIAFVDEDPSTLLPVTTVRGFILQAIRSGPAERLPDGSFYKLYRNSGRLTIDARNPPTLLYLDGRWHFGERDATGGAWVWASSNNAGLDIPLSTRTTYKMQIDAFTFGAQNGRVQAAVLQLNGQTIATLRFDERGALLTPEAQFVTGADARSHFEIVSELALPESAVNQNTANQRILAIAIRRLSFEPIESSSS